MTGSKTFLFWVVLLVSVWICEVDVVGDDNFLLPVQVGPISSLSARHQLTVRPNFPESQPLSIDTWKIGEKKWVGPKIPALLGSENPRQFYCSNTSWKILTTNMKIDAVKNGQSCPLEEKVFTVPFVLCKLDFFLFLPKFSETQRYKSVDLWTE